MLEAPDDVVHGVGDAGLGLGQVLPADPRLLKVGVAVQQLLGGGEIVIQKGVGLGLLLRLLLNEPENLAGHLLDAVDLLAEDRVGDTVVGPADIPQYAGVALLRLRGRGIVLLAVILLRGLRGQEQHVPPGVHEGALAPQALFHHDLQVLLRLGLGHVGGHGQIIDGDGLAVAHVGQVLGKSPGPALHAQTTQPHAGAACHETRHVEQILKLRHHIAGDGVANDPAQRQQAADAQYGTHQLQDLGALGAVLGGVGQVGDGLGGALHRLGRRGLPGLFLLGGAHVTGSLLVALVIAAGVDGEIAVHLLAAAAVAELGDQHNEAQGPRRRDE